MAKLMRLQTVRESGGFIEPALPFAAMAAILVEIGCARTLLGRNFVPGWETRCPCLGNGSSLVGNFLYLLGNSGFVPRNFGLPSWSGDE